MDRSLVVNMLSFNVVKWCNKSWDDTHSSFELNFLYMLVRKKFLQNLVRSRITSTCKWNKVV